MKLRAGWVHDLADVSRGFTTSFEGLPGPTFAIVGVDAPCDAALISVLGSLTMGPSLDLFLRYDAMLASDASTQGGSAGLRFVF